MINHFKIAKFFLVISVFYVTLVTTSTLFPFIVGKYVWFRSSIDLALIFFLLGLVFTSGAKIYEERFFYLIKKPFVIAVTVFVIAFLMACFFGVNPSFSFWSNFERGEGGIQVIHLYVFLMLLLILFREESDWRRIFFWFAIATVLMIFYGVGAGLKYVDAEFRTVSMDQGGIVRELTGKGGPLFQTFRDFVGLAFNEPNYRFQGSIGNAAYVAGYSLFAVFYGLYLLLTAYRKRLRTMAGVFMASLTVIFAATFISAATRGAFIGFMVSFVALLVYIAFLRRTWRKWLLGLGVVVVASFVIMVNFRDTPFVKSLPFARIFQISLSAQTFQTRTIIWKVALDGFKERPVFGWGPENFIQVFYQHFNPQYFSPSAGFGAWFDRAHSVFFDYLVETGALGLASYLGVFLVLYLEILRFSKAPPESLPKGKSPEHSLSNFSAQPAIVKGLLVAMPIAYLVQGLALFDVLTISYNLFLLLAFAGYQFYFSPSKP